MRKILALLILGCAVGAHAQIIGLQPTPIGNYFWNTSTSEWSPCPNTSTAQPFQSTPQAFVQEGLNASLGRWTPQTTCPVIALTTNGSSGPATLINGVLNIPDYTGGGGSGCVPSPSVLGSVLLDAGSGGCADGPADYNATAPGRFTIGPQVGITPSNPAANPNLTFGGNNNYSGLYMHLEQDVLPGDNPSVTFPASYLANIQYENRYPGFCPGAPGPEPDFCYGSTGLHISTLSYDAAITTALEIDDSAFKPNDTQGIDQFENWACAGIDGSGEGCEAYRLQMNEVNEWTNNVITGGSQATDITFSPGGNGFQATQLFTPLLDLTGAATGTITIGSPVTINQVTGFPSVVVAATVSGFTVTSSTSGAFLQNVEVPRLAPNTTTKASQLVQTVNVAIASNPNGQLCMATGPMLRELIRPTATLVSAGVYAITADFFRDHTGGSISTWTIANGGHSYANGNIITVVQSGGGPTATASQFTVTESGGVVTALTELSGGSNYTVASGLATANVNGGSGSGLIVNITAISGSQINCGGAVGTYIIPTSNDDFGNMYAYEVLSSTSTNSVVVGYQTQGSLASAMLVNGPVMAVQGCELHGVINPGTGLPDGGELFCEPNNGAWAPGDSVIDAHTISAQYSALFFNDSTANEFAQRNDIIINRSEWGGGVNPSNSIFRYNNSFSAFQFAGGGGTSGATAPLFMLANGPTNGLLYSRDWPLQGGSTGLTSGNCGADSGDLICVGDFATGVTSGTVFDFPGGALSFTKNALGTPSGLWDFTAIGSGAIMKAQAYQMALVSGAGYNVTFAPLDLNPFTMPCLGDTMASDTRVSSCDVSLGVGGLFVADGGRPVSGIQFGTPTISGSTYIGDASIAHSANLLNIIAATVEANGSVICTVANYAANCPGGAGSVTTSGTPTTGFFPLFTGSAVIGNSHCNDGITTASTVTCTETVSAPAFQATGPPSISTGTASNTDLAGSVTLSGGTFTYSLAGTYTTAPIVTCTDRSATPTVVGCHTTTTAIVFNGTGTDVINYILIGLN